MYLKNFNNREKIGILLFALSIFYILFTSYIGFSDLKIWADECWSLLMSYSSLNELVFWGINDVHPILYYLILKVFIKFFALFNYNNIFAIGVLVSLIPIYLLLVLCATKVRKHWGILTAGIFALCITSMPHFMEYAIEIRMYSWGLFFVTASFIYVYEIIKDSNWKKWAILTALTICSAYTHYFTAIASIMIYLSLLIYILYRKRELVKIWFISTLISILSYVPWLFIVYKQFVEVNNNFWINPITFDTVVSYVYYVLSPVEVVVRANELVPPSILGTIALIAVAILIYRYAITKNDFNSDYAIWALIIFISIPVIGIVLSLLYSPIFHARYLVPILGCFWLAISILLAKNYDNKKIFIPVLGIILIIGAVGAYDFSHVYVDEFIIEDYDEPYDEFKQYLKPGDIVVNDFLGGYLYSLIELPQCHMLLGHTGVQDVKTMLNSPNIQNEIANGCNVYLVDHGGDDYEDYTQNNITLEELDIQSYLVKIYKIST